ncbi:MAG: glycosyltransferase [Sedimenticolaceae bacterium]
MDIGVVMLVKNEVLRIEDALAPILDQLAEIIVFDTGSTDGTPDLMRERLGIEPLSGSLDPERCGSHADLRNEGLRRLESPWCLTLDADERLDPRDLRRLRKHPPPMDIGGLFFRWRNFLEQGEVFDDYKCALFRNGFTKVGLIHDNVQPSLRRTGSIAVWTDAVVLEHRPEVRKEPWKRSMYRERLACAMKCEPEVPRYPWFAGYAALQEGRPGDAHIWLSRAAQSRHPLYPVERINARVALTALSACQGKLDETRAHLALATALWKEMREDFEVSVNRWLEPWLLGAAANVAAGDLEPVTVPRFAC